MLNGENIAVHPQQDRHARHVSEQWSSINSNDEAPEADKHHAERLGINT